MGTCEAIQKLAEENHQSSATRIVCSDALIEALLFNECFHRQLGHPKYFSMLRSTSSIFVAGVCRGKCEQDGTDAWNFGLQALLAAGLSTYS